MSAFTQTIKESAEYCGVLNSIQKGFLPQGVLGLTPVQKALEPALDNACKALELLLDNQIDKAMNQFNS